MSLRSERPPGRKKKLIWLTVFLAVFYGLCLFQLAGHQREDWPFSWFGMFKGKMGTGNIIRVDLDVLTPSGEVIQFFQYRVNGYYIHDRFENLILNAGVDHEGEYEGARQALVEDVLPVLESHGVSRDSILRLKFRFWKEFAADKRNHPDKDRVILEVPWKELL